MAKRLSKHDKEVDMKNLRKGRKKREGGKGRK
jgi:hypothetical protein